MFANGFPGSASARALSALKPEPESRRRGPQAIQLYRSASPAVVLIVTEDGLGSGSLLNDRGEILTNWHVVRGNRVVAVIFKPAQEGAQPTQADVRRGQVLRVDEVADLALVRVEAVPAGVTPLKLGSAAEIAVGADVHAIGHPTGEAWTYTKGVISQLRRDYVWTSNATGKEHRATVIQTQTPINPGNSGGPLLSDRGTILGVNSFKAEGEALNFAVSVDDVRRFLAASTDRLAPAARQRDGKADSCQEKELYRGARQEEGYDVVGVDLNCDGRVDAELRLPFDTSLPLLAVVDRNADGKPDIVVFSYSRNGSWDLSFHDEDFDGAWDLVGHHPDGKLIASRYESYTAYSARVARK